MSPGPPREGGGGQTKQFALGPQLKGVPKFAKGGPKKCNKKNKLFVTFSI